MKSQLWTIREVPGWIVPTDRPDEVVQYPSLQIVDEHGEVIAECRSHGAAVRIVTHRAAALAGAAWIFGNTYEGTPHPHLPAVQPVIEAALGPQGHREKQK